MLQSSTSEESEQVYYCLLSIAIVIYYSCFYFYLLLPTTTTTTTLPNGTRLFYLLPAYWPSFLSQDCAVGIHIGTPRYRYDRNFLLHIGLCFDFVRPGNDIGEPLNCERGY